MTRCSLRLCVLEARVRCTSWRWAAPLCSAGKAAVRAIGGVLDTISWGQATRTARARCRTDKPANTHNWTCCLRNGSSISSIIARLCKCLSLEFNTIWLLWEERWHPAVVSHILCSDNGETQNGFVLSCIFIYGLYLFLGFYLFLLNRVVPVMWRIAESLKHFLTVFPVCSQVMVMWRQPEAGRCVKHMGLDELVSLGSLLPLLISSALMASLFHFLLSLILFFFLLSCVRWVLIRLFNKHLHWPWDVSRPKALNSIFY